MSTNKSKSEISDNTIDGAFSHANVIKDNGKIESQQNNSTVSDKENNNQIIQGDGNIIIQVNKIPSTADISEKVANLKEETQISFMISGTGGKKLQTTLKALEKHLQGLADDVTMTIIDVDEGSLKFVLQGTPEGLERIERLFNSGELTEIFDVPIESVEFIEPEKEKLAFTITGDISYTDVAKLKAEVTGVDEKELLIQKIRTNGGKKKLNLSGANLSGANLSGANLSTADLIKVYLTLSRADLIRANLSKANLIRAKLSGANLIGANLSKANLSGGILSRANLIGAILSGADLRGAILRGAILSGANLSGANLSGADLNGADLSTANLSEAELRDSKVINTKFSSNSPGMNEQLKQDLIQQGAIFEDSLEDPVLTPIGR
ncbi:MAG: pentapeptide repeat-containing protein [Microcoleaceae cyanobacterium]